VNQRMSFATFVILLLVIATQMGQYFFTNMQLRRERDTIATQYETQTPQLETARELRSQFDGIASAVARLADEGNPNAVRVRDELAARGVNIKAPAASPAPAN
jgi:hypothetical protein